MRISANLAETMEVAIKKAEDAGQDKVSVLGTTAKQLGLAGPLFRNSANMAIPIPIADLKAVLAKAPKEEPPKADPKPKAAAKPPKKSEKKTEVPAE